MIKPTTVKTGRDGDSFTLSLDVEDVGAEVHRFTRKEWLALIGMMQHEAGKAKESTCPGS